ncbi:MAG: hypothetical protein QM532_01725 [Cyanobium sp. MAG06]|nr:hypothetical protein [Cyanobium sp. MAG06]
MTDIEIKENQIDITDNREYNLLPYSFLLENISKNIPLSNEDEVKLCKSYNIAVKYHTPQLRNSGEPYVNHCI